MTRDQAIEAQMRQIAGGIIDTADPIWGIDDRPTGWDRVRRLHSQAGNTIAALID